MPEIEETVVVKDILAGGNLLMPGLFRGAKYNSITLIGAAGDNDIYTVPANKKALVFEYYVSNATAGSIAHQPKIKIGATTFIIGASKSEPAAGRGHNYGMTAAQQSAPILLNEGEKFLINNDVLGLTMWISIIEFNASTTPYYRADIQTWINGDNTLLTVPAGKTALLSLAGFAASNNPGPIMNGIVYWNTSGGSRNLSYISFVPDLGSPATNNRFAEPGSILNNQGFTKAFVGCLASGFRVVINSDGSGAQYAFCNYTLV